MAVDFQLIWLGVAVCSMSAAVADCGGSPANAGWLGMVDNQQPFSSYERHNSTQHLPVVASMAR